MSSFFFPSPVESGLSASAEASDRAVRLHAEKLTGLVAHPRRIREMMCRRDGSDQILRVGEEDAHGFVVRAILQLGRDVYTVHHDDATALPPARLTVLDRHDVYSVTEFDHSVSV